jgi:diguanylate cyclase (GGDEF)-like protein/PAS domain S-box-containing protein
MNRIKRPADIFHRFTLATKVVLISLLVGAVLLLMADRLGIIAVKNVFVQYLEDNLQDKALRYRVSFIQHVNQHQQLAQVMATHHFLIHYLKDNSEEWEKPLQGEAKFMRRPPEWVPGNSLLRTFTVPRFILLLDPSGVAREVYRTRMVPVPEFLLKMSPRTLILSKGESYLLTLPGDLPYLIVSEDIEDAQGEVIATLLLASPVDKEFIESSHTVLDEGFIVGLLDEEDLIFTSSHEDIIPPGTALGSLDDDYLVIGQEFLEYGGSELNFRFVSLVDKNKVDLLMQPVISSNRLVHFSQSFLFFIAFILLMYFNANRIKRLTFRITEFSRENLGGVHQEAGSWDEIYVLEERFKLLTSEVLHSAEEVKREAEEHARGEEELRNKETQLDLLQAVTEAAGMGVALATDGNVTPINSKMDYYCSMYGEPDCFNISKGKDREMDVEYHDGSLHTFQVMSPILDIEEKVILAMDITDKKNSMEKIIQSKNDWESTFNSITDAITIHDENYNIVLSNTAAQKMIELPGFLDDKSKCFNHFHDHGESASRCPVCECMMTGRPATQEYFDTILNKYIELRVIPRFDSTGVVKGVIQVIRNITQRKTLEDELTRQALYDSLTLLPNKILFMDRVKNLFDHISRKKDLVFAVLFLDLDNFKKINDSLGHVIGDELLKAVTERLKYIVRPGDTVSRFGGDEFALLLDSIGGIREATEFAERVHEEINKPFTLTGGREVFVTASIGIAVGHSGYESPEDLLRDADTAMYHSKARGKDCYILFDEQMHHKAVEELNMENDLRRALERDEFELYFQPIVDVITQNVYGFEALIRWNHPINGQLQPDSFIPIAEDTGLIIPIGEWVIEEAARQLSYWYNEVSFKSDFYVSVNLSPKQFHSDLPTFIERCLIEHDLPPGVFCVEITEGLLMKDPDMALSLMTKLKNMNVRVFLDDFGTGYSSLNYIHKFPIDTLKIDRSFVLDILNDNEALEIVNAIISLADKLEIEVIAEGVESMEHLEALMEMGCKYIQGYLFSKPLAKKLADTYIHSLKKDPSKL